MNRKQKIVVSIVGITIVLLALLGLTYAYYLTRIQGNTNTTSISITTADLKLEYSEGQNSNIDITGLMPGQDIKTKTFTVTNSGNNRVDNYVVAIIDVTNTLTRTEDLTYTLTCVQKNAEGVVTGTCRGVDTDPDTEYPTQNSMIVTNSIDAEYSHEYTLKLTYENLTDTDQSIDMGSTIKGKVQIYGLADTIDLTGDVTGINPGDYVQINSEQMTSQIVDGKYTLIGIEPGVHSLKIMNKDGVKQKEQYIKINKGEEVSVTTGSITLEDESTVNGPIITMVDTSREATIDINKTTGDYTPNNKVLDYNPFKEGTFAYKIVDNAINSTDFGTEAEGYAVYRLNPTTKPAEEVSNSDEASLSQTADYYTESTGINSYYFRGNVKNNYVSFANKCWRIVRVEGDGSVKLTLASNAGTCEKDGVLSRISAVLNNYDGYEDVTSSWYNENLTAYENDLKEDIVYLHDGNEYVYENEFGGIEGTTDLFLRLTDEAGNETWLKNKYYPRLTIPASSNQKESKIFRLTPDEVVFAGMKYGTSSEYSYLYDNAQIAEDDYNLENAIGGYYLDGFYAEYEDEYGVTFGIEDKFLAYNEPYHFERPTITLRPEVKVDGDIGTQDRPYVVENITENQG